MARINLLPWRQEERERKNKEFAITAGAVATLTILTVLLAMTYLSNEMSSQQATNDMIRNENTRLDGVLTEIEGLEQRRTEMLDRMKIVQDLQGRRFVPVQVWEDIARTIPQAMYMVSMKRENDTITFSGFAADANVVSEFVRRLDATPWLGGSGVPNIQTDLQAYEVPPSLSQSRPIEGRYVRFTVTTHIRASKETVVDVGTDSVQPTESQAQVVETEAQPIAPEQTVVAPESAAIQTEEPAPSVESQQPVTTEQATAGGQ